jgi:hypothetical protein
MTAADNPVQGYVLGVAITVAYFAGLVDER